MTNNKEIIQEAKKFEKNYKFEDALNLLEELYKIRSIKTWYRDKREGWILHSGLWSPIYISLREITSKKPPPITTLETKYARNLKNLCLKLLSMRSKDSDSGLNLYFDFIINFSQIYFYH